MQDEIAAIGIPARLALLLSDSDKASQVQAARCLATYAATSAEAAATAPGSHAAASQAAGLMIEALHAPPVVRALWDAVERYHADAAAAAHEAAAAAAAAAAGPAITPRSRGGAAAGAAGPRGKAGSVPGKDPPGEDMALVSRRTWRRVHA